MMTRLDFSHNWNNKLNCNCYTTFRLHNASKYIAGTIFDVYLKDEYLHRAVVVDVRTLLLDSVNNYIAMLDAGYNVDEFKKLVGTMYKNIVKDFRTQKFDFILLQQLNENE